MYLNYFLQHDKKDKIKYYIVVYTKINHICTDPIIKNEIFIEIIFKLMFII